MRRMVTWLHYWTSIEFNWIRFYLCVPSWSPNSGFIWCCQQVGYLWNKQSDQVGLASNNISLCQLCGGKPVCYPDVITLNVYFGVIEAFCKLSRPKRNSPRLGLNPLDILNNVLLCWVAVKRQSMTMTSAPGLKWMKATTWKLDEMLCF